jgi:hypothetical protein
MHACQPWHVVRNKTPQINGASCCETGRAKYIFGMASKYILLSRANNKMTRKFELGERDTFIYKLRHE